MQPHSLCTVFLNVLTSLTACSSSQFKSFVLAYRAAIGTAPPPYLPLIFKSFTPAKLICYYYDDDNDSYPSYYYYYNNC
uniref:Secreted protein n=1 Tax=Anguilla anguilla TaxID=7936 RepID=A0A0E9SLX1_ANGAN